MEIFVVYESPRDYPGLFVLRKWTVGFMVMVPEPEPMAVEKNLVDARAAIPDGFYRRSPSVGDDPVILEIWL